MPNTSDTKSNIVPGVAQETRVDLGPLNECDFSPSDPSGNQRGLQRPFRYCKAEEFADGSWMKKNREASTPRDHKGVPGVKEVPLKDPDEIPSSRQ